MKMEKWIGSALLVVLFLVLVGCGKDIGTSGLGTTDTGTGGGNTNRSPVISSLTANPATVVTGGTTSFACTATDADNDLLTFVWSASSGTISGTGGTVSWTASTTAGTATISCTTSDGKAEASTQAIVPVSTWIVQNSTPVISSLTANPATVVTGGTTSFACIATDADNDLLTFVWSASSGTISGTGGTVSWTAPATEGSATITCKASDGKAEASTQAIVPVSTWIVQNSTPVISSLTANPATVVTGGTTSFACTATDADNDLLTYAWSASSGTISGTGGTVSWTASTTAGTATISCTTSDGKAEASTQANATVSEWILSTQFADSAPNAFVEDCIRGGVVYDGRLYLVWVVQNEQRRGNEHAYLSIFDTNTASAVELSRTEILSPENTSSSDASSVAVDQDGIYISGDMPNGGPFLTALDFNTTVKWALHTPQYLDDTILMKIVVQNGFVYITGFMYGTVPGFANAGDYDVLVGKYATSGNLVWLIQWGTSASDRGENIKAETDGLLVGVNAGNTSMTGMTTPPPAYIGNLTLKYDFDGNLISVTQ